MHGGHTAICLGFILDVEYTVSKKKHKTLALDKVFSIKIQTPRKEQMTFSELGAGELG